ncbi:1-phosphofructokinase family hexose kinase [Nocardioides nanhaiensis]|uniref:Hexose kinase n=1 Tax=Nocardioides nanhaiensis TaxID=1476871 RepID=A0ABP8WU20_9ACTN
MIITLTANPSIDRTVVLTEPLERGAVHRLASVGTQAAGKGVNISRAAVAAGEPTLAVLPAAEHDPYVQGLVADQVPVRPVPPAGGVRINLAITEPDGTTTKLNSPGDTVGPADLELLGSALVEAARGCGHDDWVVMAGSVPPGTPADWYAGLVRDLRELRSSDGQGGHGPRVAVDTSDAPLAALVAGLPGSAPHLVKPNSDELASLTGADPLALEGDPAATVAAATSLVERGIESVLATLGGEGAVLVTADGAWHATPPPTEVVSTVGAGDSSLFGFLLGERRGLGPADRLALAVAYGSAAAGLPGTTIPLPAQVDPTQVRVRQLHTTS